MWYRNSSKNRKLKRTLINIVRFIKFESLNISLSYKFVLVWVIIWIISLFMNWVESSSFEITWNAFNSLLWITGYIIFSFLLITLFFIFNKNKQEKVKTILNLIIKDWNLIIFLFLFCLVLTINSIFYINWLNTFKQSIIIWQWIIFWIIWDVFWLIGWYLILKEKTKTWIIIDDSVEQNPDIYSINNWVVDKNNMKLPF